MVEAKQQEKSEIDEEEDDTEQCVLLRTEQIAGEKSEDCLLVNRKTETAEEKKKESVG